MFLNKMVHILLIAAISKLSFHFNKVFSAVESHISLSKHPKTIKEAP